MPCSQGTDHTAQVDCGVQVPGTADDFARYSLIYAQVQVNHIQAKGPVLLSHFNIAKKTHVQVLENILELESLLFALERLER